MPNIEDPDFQQREGAPPGFRAYRARVGYELGSERIGASVWKLPPGEAAYPYHFHYSDEELVFVSERQADAADAGRDAGARAGRGGPLPARRGGRPPDLNPTEEEVRFLAVSTNGAPDIVVYPDSNKISASERLPEGGGLHTFFDLDSQVEYWKGESARE